MKKIATLFCLVPTLILAQSNFFVSEGNLSQIRPTSDGGYVGGDADGNLVKLTTDFEFGWAVGTFAGELKDLEVDLYTGTVTAIHILEDECNVTQLSSAGETLNRTTYHFNGPVEDADLEWTSEGFAYAFKANLSISATQPSLILAASNVDLDLSWTKSFETPLNYLITELDLESYNDSIAVLVNSTNADSNYVQFCRLGIDGTLYGATNIGTDCSYYTDFDRLSGGGFVLVGELVVDEDEMLRVSVLDENGLVLATKSQRTSWSDSGWNRATVSALSDGRYVVCNNYFEGHGGYNQGAFIYFDNHKAVGQWNFHPIDLIEDRDKLSLWCVDLSDKLIFSGTVYDEEFGTNVNETMGRITWKSEDCGLGIYSGTTFEYGIDPSEEISIELNEMDNLEANVLLDDLVPHSYMSVFACSDGEADPGLEVLDNHLYGDTIPTCYPEVIDNSGLEENHFAFSVYPNPSNGLVTIEATERSLVHVFNSQGALIETIYPTGTKTSLTLGDIKGIYLIQLIDQNGRTRSTEIIRL
jgi:hypothetical protein